MTEPHVSYIVPDMHNRICKVSRMRMKFEKIKAFLGRSIERQLVLGRLREWERPLKTKKYVKFLCIFSFKCIIISSGKVECALLLAFLF